MSSYSSVRSSIQHPERRENRQLYEARILKGCACLIATYAVAKQYGISGGHSLSFLVST